MARPSDSQLDAQIEATLQAARDLGCEAAVKKDIELFDLLAEVDENDLVARLTTQYKLTHEKVGLIIKGISDEDFFFLAPHLGITDAVISRAKLIWKGIAPAMQPPPPPPPAAGAADKPPAAASAASDASADGLPPPPPPPGGADASAVAGAAGAAGASSAAQSKTADDSSTPEPPARRNSDSTTDAPGADVPAGGSVFNTDDDGAGVTRDMKSRAAALSAHDNKASLLASPKATGGAASPMSTSSTGSNAAAAGAGAGQVAGASFSGASFSSGMSFVTAPPDAKILGSEKAHSYAEITHSFTIVSRQIENGLLSCKRVIAFLKKFTGEQQKYAKELIAITAHESNKIHKLQDDGMRRYNTAFGGFQEAMVDMSKLQEAYSNKILAEVVTPLTEYHAKAETRRKAILDDEKKVTTQMKACTDALTKQKLTCLRMLDALKTRKEKKTKEDDDKKKAGGAGAGFLSSLKSKVASVTESTMEEQTDKCYKELVVYQQQIKTSNERAKQYYTVELPRIFDQLQQLETQRLNTLRDYMKKYVDIQSGSMEPFKSMCMVLGRKVGGMHAASDMNEWVASIIKQHGAVPELRPFQYDLPITPEDVKANRLDPSENSNSLFRSTLPRIMELQKAKYPSLDLPKLIVTLVGWIREFDGGVKTKGLFRISASKDELLQLKKQLEKGDYDTKSNTNPHAAAGLLKEFLRELQEPLFPQDLYNDCVAAVKDLENTPPAEMAKKVMGLFDKLPPLTQRVIKFVGVLLREVSSPENAAVNLMTMDNLAIVFAPSLLRCPHDDPMEMLSNSKFETRFAAILFSSLH